jgi:hypothetical protein
MTDPDIDSELGAVPLRAAPPVHTPARKAPAMTLSQLCAECPDLTMTAGFFREKKCAGECWIAEAFKELCDK